VLLPLLSMLLALTVSPSMDFPETWECRIEEVFFEPGHECQPTRVITYCPEPHRTYMDTFKLRKMGEDLVCLPSKREEIDLELFPSEI